MELPMRSVYDYDGVGDLRLHLARVPIQKGFMDVFMEHLLSRTGCMRMAKRAANKNRKYRFDAQGIVVHTNQAAVYVREFFTDEELTYLANYKQMPPVAEAIVRMAMELPKPAKQCTCVMVYNEPA